MKLEGNTAVVNGKVYNINVAEGLAAAPVAVSPGATEAVKSQMPGAVVRITAAKGTKVKAGDTLLVQEAMKMEVEVKSPVDGTVVEILVATGDQVTADQILVQIQTEGTPMAATAATPAAPAPVAAPVAETGEEVKAQMPGTVVKVLVASGSTVKSGDTLLVQEAMKMEVEVKAPVDGTVTSVSVSAGDQVASGQCLVTIA